MIKVVHVVSDTNIGGAGRWLLNFLKEVNREVFDIKTIVPEQSLLTNEIKKLNGQVVEMPHMADQSFDMQAVKSLYQFFKYEKPDIVHTHANLSARVAAKMAGVKHVIYTKHCIDPPLTDGIKKSMKALGNNLLSDRAIAVSNAVKDNLIDAGIPDSKITVIHNGVDKLKELTDVEKDAIRMQWGIKQNEIVIGIFARLEEVKGHRYLIDAVRIITNEFENIKLLIVGTGSLEQTLKDQVKKLELTDHVIFTGYINDITLLMNIIDINVISSTSEAICLSIIEGMSIGKPCVATITGGIPEVVQEGYNGKLVPIEDATALSNAIQALIKDEELRKKMGENARAFMDKHFTAHEMTRKLEEVYKNLELKQN